LLDRSFLHLIHLMMTKLNQKMLVHK